MPLIPLVHGQGADIRTRNIMLPFKLVVKHVHLLCSRYQQLGATGTVNIGVVLKTQTTSRLFTFFLRQGFAPPVYLLELLFPPAGWLTPRADLMVSVSGPIFLRLLTTTFASVLPDSTYVAEFTTSSINIRFNGSLLLSFTHDLANAVTSGIMAYADVLVGGEPITSPVVAFADIEPIADVSVLASSVVPVAVAFAIISSVIGFITKLKL